MLLGAILSKVQNILSTCLDIKTKTDLIGGPSGTYTSIKSIQSGVIVATTTHAASPGWVNGSNTATITAVTLGKSHVVFGDFTITGSAASNPTQAYASVTLTNATTVTANVSSMGSASVTGTFLVRYTVVEYN